MFELDVALEEALDVRAGGEELRVGALDDDDADRGAATAASTASANSAHERQVVGVGRRVIERDEADRALGGEGDGHVMPALRRRPTSIST